MMKEVESATKASVLEAAAQPINRRSTPEEQAGPLVFLNSDVASYVNGVCFYVDGGFMAGLATGQIDVRSLMGGLGRSVQLLRVRLTLPGGARNAHVLLRTLRFLRSGGQRPTPDRKSTRLNSSH